MLLPNRGAAHRFVTELIGLLPKEQARSVHNLQRFEEEFGFDSEPTPGMLRKPKDFQEVRACSRLDLASDTGAPCAGVLLQQR